MEELFRNYLYSIKGSCKYSNRTIKHIMQHADARMPGVCMHIYATFIPCDLHGLSCIRSYTLPVPVCVGSTHDVSFIVASVNCMFQERGGKLFQ